MLRFTFRGGIHPDDGKAMSKDKPIREVLPKGELVYPLSQHIGAPAKAIVAKGDHVLAGQKIAEAGGFVSANIFASVSGTVKAIEARLGVAGGMQESIVIENDGLYEEVEFSPERKLADISGKEIIEIIKEAGLDHIRFTDLRHTCAVLSLRNGMETKELARMLGHYRPSITRQNYEPYLPHKVQKDEDIPNEATQGELQQAANALDNLLKF